MNYCIQQEIYILSNLKLMFSNIRYIFNSLRFVFNEMEFIELKSFTFSKPRLNVTKKAFCRTKDLVCKLYMSSVSISHSFRVFFAYYRDDVQERSFVFLLRLYWSMNYVKGWVEGGGLATTMWTSTKFLYEYN